MINFMAKYQTVSGTLDGISPLIVGGAVFNTQYNDRPHEIQITDIIKFALDNGMNAFDTSPYYGPSEELMGQAFKELTECGVIARDNYYVCTKVGRIQLDNFDYSAEWVRKSIARSLRRLNTDYLDIVHLHDIEFCTEEQIFEALTALMELKKQGTIHYIGVSGYPVEFLYQIAKRAATIEAIGPLDSVLSYSNMCLQNTILNDYHDRFFDDCRIKMLNNASILSMSLLRTGKTHAFHPAPQTLKDACERLGEELKEKHNADLTSLAVRFAFRNWADKRGSTLVGCSNVAELAHTVEQYKAALVKETEARDTELTQFAQSFLGDHFNETWPGGIH